MGQITNGIDKIEIAEVGQTNWRVLGYTNIDSAELLEEDGTTTDFNVEELDDPLFTRFVPGKKTLTFQIADPDLNTFKEVFGGNISGVGNAAVWEAPTHRVTKEYAVRITPQIGYVMEMPRVVLKPKMNFQLGKNRISMIDISADILKPTGGAASISIGNKVTEEGSTGTLQPQTITFGTQADLAVGDTRTLPATASSGLVITYQSTDPAKVSVNGNVITGVSLGIAQIIATQMGNTMYAAATPVVQEIDIISA